MSNLLYPVTEDILHWVFYAYGAKKIYMHQMKTRVEASVQFQSCEDAKYAPKTFHGRDIYDGCCRMDIHLELPSPAATSSNSVPTTPFCQRGADPGTIFFFGGGGLNYAVCSTSSHLGAFSLSFMVKKIEGSAPEVSMGLVGVGGT